MSVKIMSMVFDAVGLSSNQKIVLLSLADHGSDEGISIYPSIRKTSKRTGLSEREVRRTQQELVEIGLLEISEGGGRKTNHYKIILGNLKLLEEGNYNNVNPCLPDTPVCESGHPCPPDTPPLSVSQGTPDRESSESLYNRNRNKKIKSNILPPGEASENLSFEEEKNEGKTNAGGENCVPANSAVYVSDDLLDTVPENGNTSLSDDPDLSWLKSHLKPFASVYLKTLGNRYAPAKSERKLWYKVLNEWVEAGFTPDDVSRAIKVARDAHMVIKGPQSITWAMRDRNNGERSLQEAGIVPLANIRK